MVPWRLAPGFLHLLSGGSGPMAMDSRKRLLLPLAVTWVLVALAVIPHLSVRRQTAAGALRLEQEAGGAGEISLGSRAVPAVQFVMGMTSVVRAEHPGYLHDTLRSLACAVAADSVSGAPPVPLLLLNSEVDPANHTMMQQVRADAALNASPGLRIDYLAVGGLHPEMRAALQPNGTHNISDQIYKDKPDRVWWRSRHVLDTAYIMERALELTGGASKGTPQWFLHLEVRARARAGDCPGAARTGARTQAFGSGQSCPLALAGRRTLCGRLSDQAGGLPGPLGDLWATRGHREPVLIW